MSKSTAAFWQSPVKTMLLSGFIAGTLDILGAILVYVVIQGKTTTLKMSQSIASGIFGKGAYAGGMTMACYGLMFHFLIAFSFAAGYFLSFPYIPFLQKQKIISGVLYGIFIWLVMNLIVIPFVFARRAPITWSSSLRAIAILIVMIGLPVSFITHKYYANREP
jgi:hypothetical protein